MQPILPSKWRIFRIVYASKFDLFLSLRYEFVTKTPVGVY